MPETSDSVPPTAATMRLDGGHPVLELVNTVYGQVGAAPEADVLATPQDVVTLARRLGLAGDETRASRPALRAARALRDGLDAVLRARIAHATPPPAARAAVERAARAAIGSAELAPHGAALAWAWPPGDALTPVHRLALAAVELLASEPDLERLHSCAGCRWLFIDRSRGAGRRWCSMAECGTDAKKRRYVQRRRERRKSSRA
jgi:predicted RNA-binding Zn ribbon-like protein